MNRILFALIMMLSVMDLNAQPEWPRRYAITVVRGHAYKLPKEEIVSRGQASKTNLQGDMAPFDQGIQMDADSTCSFWLKWKLCWPMEVSFNLCDVRFSMPLAPGDTVDIELDYPKAQELKDDDIRMQREAIAMRGATLQRSPEGKALLSSLLWKAAYIDADYMNAHCRADFEAFREWKWQLYQKRLKEVKKAKVKKAEKALLRLEMERQYLTDLYSYNFLMDCLGCDSTEMAAAKAQFSNVDPHAASFQFPHSIASAYYFGTGYLEYLQANGLAELPLGRYLKERQQAEAVVARLKTMRPVSDADIRALAPEFQEAIHDFQEELDRKLREEKAQQPADSAWMPTGSPDTWLAQMVERHAGHVVFVDFWATWCGPCQKGISEMATVKEEYEKQGVDFVYITDNSSSADGFLDIQTKHPGDHFMFLQNEIKEMNVPGYSGAIPHYLIYGRDGKLVKYVTGWSSLENMKQELDKALGD